MNKISLIFGVICLISGCIAGDESGAVITKYTSHISQDGSYGYEFGTSNNIQAAETGVGSSYAEGSVQYIAPDGQPIHLEYTADVNGYQPKGDHLPTPPPIPDYILRGLAYIESHPFQVIQVKK
ncbi:pupal cuticle protein Edg-78E [Drosophila grimshawi]|uniref:GH16083 n=1 Tax=Drosophila grimshawi TaxID=7222 RepID=B4J353_DROGR|nr:pupal cuticle protein Edg-78E [Drosophila grimshawi]EDV96124.1 GH16083 [Drosophila grimshawi]